MSQKYPHDEGYPRHSYQLCVISTSQRCETDASRQSALITQCTARQAPMTGEVSVL